MSNSRRAQLEEDTLRRRLDKLKELFPKMQNTDIMRYFGSQVTDGKALNVRKDWQRWAAFYTNSVSLRPGSCSYHAVVLALALGQAPALA